MPDRQQRPVVQRVRIRYGKRGRLRFASHRDFARALERAVRRAAIPIGYSAGFSPHPKISYIGAAPTGVASQAEYAELGLTAVMDPDAFRAALDAALPGEIEILEAVTATEGSLADRINASRYRLELPGITPDRAEQAVRKFTDAEQVLVERLTKQGRRTLDARAAVVRCAVRVPPAGPAGTASGEVSGPSGGGVAAGAAGEPCAILDLVVRHVTPSVRPEEVLAGLRSVAGLEPTAPVRATRLAQGLLTERGDIADPLQVDRDGVSLRQIDGVTVRPSPGSG